MGTHRRPRWHRLLRDHPRIPPVALAAVLFASVAAAWVAEAANLRPVYGGSFTGEKFVAGTGVYCPAVTPPPSWDFAAGSSVLVEWNETHGFAVSASVGKPDGWSIPCPEGVVPSGNCSFIANGGTFTIYFQGPIPASQPGYTVDYEVRYVGPGPAVAVPWPG